VDSFAFIIHPIDPRRDIQRKYPLLGRIATDWMIYHFSPLWPPVYLSEIEGITSAHSGKQIKGYLIACPLSPIHFLGLPEKQVYRKIIETGRLAEKLGANLLGLGAFTSVVGDAGRTIASALEIPVTTGDAYTIAVAVASLRDAARLMEIPMETATAAVVGAAGSIGKVCAEMLATQVGELKLVGRRIEPLQALKQNLIERYPQVNLTISTEMKDLRQAQLILTVTSAIDAVILPEHIRSGAVICDVARPRDVARQVAQSRPDVLVIDGGMVDVPGPVDFHFNFGFPPGKAYACMAETMALTLEGHFVDYTIGKDIQLDQVRHIEQLANKHGFRTNGFRSFEKPVTEEQIQKVRESASIK
jgi:predicted amino acid dehydrogenase